MLNNVDTPFDFFDIIFYCINLDSEKGRWKNTIAQAEQLGFAERVQRFSAIETPENHHIGCALSHRGVI